MQIVCPKCQAEYELDPPAAPFARDQDLVFRCSTCSTAISLKRGPQKPVETEAKTPSPPQPAPTQASPSFLLKQDGSSYHVRDEAMLQRWIAERRIWPDDTVSADGGPLQRVGNLEQYAVFFRLVEQAEGGASTGEQPRNPGLSVSERPALFARPSNLDVSQRPTPRSSGADGADSQPTAVEVSVDQPIGEVVPDEASTRLASAAFGGIGPDEPTMDMDLGEEDFFSEEQTAIAERSGYDGTSPAADADEPLEWDQRKGSSMIMWWLMFLGALGGVAYLGLGYLNARDADQSKAGATAQVDAAETPNLEAAAESLPKVEAVPKPEAMPEAAPEVEVVPPPPAAPKAASSPKPPATPASPPRTNAKRETDRGWGQIEVENWSGARAHFSKALSADPASPDARLGMAYVDEHQGRVPQAVAQYCRLKATGKGEVQLEAAGRLRALGKDCP